MTFVEEILYSAKINSSLAQSAGAVKYNDCFSAEG